MKALKRTRTNEKGLGLATSVAISFIPGAVTAVIGSTITEQMASTTDSIVGKLLVYGVGVACTITTSTAVYKKTFNTISKDSISKYASLNPFNNDYIIQPTMTD